MIEPIATDHNRGAGIQSSALRPAVVSRIRRLGAAVLSDAGGRPGAVYCRTRHLKQQVAPTAIPTVRVPAGTFAQKATGVCEHAALREVRD
ncbi:hypothetical protein [Paractinoplanes durhamensis]|uniref:Uncharacterized protein n=1 Tax=Paractinoplanes durhamensis TaxID=113563 RepID=A0ABQ3Z0Q1_9ACTN|nr:hypothetical protein [Actinoplanes durhamensis]GIE03402.1 hypothetical protein Adu01nite_47520 [Actinoplanes durhamensis]